MGGKVQWWHILIFVIAAVLIIWRVGAATMESRKPAENKVVEGEYKNLARPGTKTHQMFEEK
ncbi:MAG: hypothetical protein GX446_16425 [Chthonomonadales bacterium]|nr:hypothetical protein [Chthonomonadales bacterium]